MGQGDGAKPRERKCLTCRHYQASPLWRKGWCRNPLLYDAQTNHLVEADALACSRTFIDYWEARDGTRSTAPNAPLGPSPVRRAPSIQMTPTGPGGTPLRSTAVTVAAVQAAAAQPRERERPPQLSLIRSEPVQTEPTIEPPLRLDILPLPLIPPPVEAKPAALPAAPHATPALEEDRSSIRNVLVSGILIAALGAGFVLTRHPVKSVTSDTLTVVPSSPVAAAAPPTATHNPLPTPTNVRPTVIVTPAPLMVGLGAKVQTTGLAGAALNVRQNPGTKGIIVGHLVDGRQAQIKAGPQQADGVGWWQITGWDNGGTLGWVSGKYLKPVP